MRWHEHESYLCSDPCIWRFLCPLSSRRSRGQEPGVLLAPPAPSPLRKEMVPQSRLLAPVLFPLAEYPCSTETLHDFGTKKGYQHMNTNTSVNNPSTVPAREPYITGSVTSQDGTTIGYRQLGHGPGGLLLHGALESAQSHMQLADALADTFTHYLPDRRRAGLSRPYAQAHSIHK